MTLLDLVSSCKENHEVCFWRRKLTPIHNAVCLTETDPPPPPHRLHTTTNLTISLSSTQTSPAERTNTEWGRIRPPQSQWVLTLRATMTGSRNIWKEDRKGLTYASTSQCRHAFTTSAWTRAFKPNAKFFFPGSGANVLSDSQFRSDCDGQIVHD
jgi:hypothetical protein